MRFNKLSDSATPENKNWYKDRYETVLTHRNFLAVIACFNLLLALTAAGTILYLIPSKTVIPFLIQVDEKTGATQILDPTSQETISADESLRKYFVVKFIRARESYDANDIDVNSNIVRLLSAQPIYHEFWNNSVNPSNKKGLYVNLGAMQIRQVQVKAVQFLDHKRAQVRFSAIERDRNSEKGVTAHYIALVGFEFANLKLSLNDLLVNPLGFRVTSYKVDEDANQ